MQAGKPENSVFLRNPTKGYFDEQSTGGGKKRSLKACEGEGLEGVALV